MPTKFWGKRVFYGQALAKNDQTESPAFWLGDSGDAHIEGDLTVSNLTVNQIRLKGDSYKTHEWSFVYSADFGAIAPAGTITSAAVLNIAASGAAVGDIAQVIPTGSIDDRMILSAAVFSAANVHLVAKQNGSGDYDAGGIRTRVVLQRYA